MVFSNPIVLVPLGLVMGIVFGIALEKSRVFEPGVIVGQMQLKTFVMLKVFLTAVATGLCALAVLKTAGLITLHPKPTIYAADVVGGLLLGAGISISGACPGTVMAQIGAGYRDSWAVLVGGLFGAVTYGYLDPWFQGNLLADNRGNLTLDTVTGVPFWALAAAGVVLIVASLIALERRRSWRKEVGPALDGLMSGD